MKYFYNFHLFLKAFWRLFLILIAMETYIDWSNSYLTGDRVYPTAKNDSE